MKLTEDLKLNLCPSITHNGFYLLTYGRAFTKEECEAKKQQILDDLNAPEYDALRRKENVELNLENQKLKETIANLDMDKIIDLNTAKLKEQVKIKSESIENMTLTILGQMNDILNLKGEIRELKKHLPDMTKWTIGVIIKELEEHPEYTRQEIIQRHKDLYRDSPSSKYLQELKDSNNAYIDACDQWNKKYYYLQQELEQIKSQDKEGLQ